VLAVIIGGKLCLTALGRALPAATTDKHRIKAIDRLLGNRLLHGEIPLFYRALAAWLLRKTCCPVIAVDWTGVGPHHFELSAKLCADGRALPLYSRVFLKKLQGNRAAHRALLMELASILPPGSTPVFVTDSGFHSNWFEDVVWHGWNYIGRVRGSTHAAVDGRWYKLRGLYRRASSRIKDLGWALLPSTNLESIGSCCRSDRFPKGAHDGHAAGRLVEVRPRVTPPKLRVSHGCSRHRYEATRSSSCRLMDCACKSSNRFEIARVFATAGACVRPSRDRAPGWR